MNNQQPDEIYDEILTEDGIQAGDLIQIKRGYGDYYFKETHDRSAFEDGAIGYFVERLSFDMYSVKVDVYTVLVPPRFLRLLPIATRLKAPPKSEE